MMQAIVELMGEPGVGKTTLANALGEELAPAEVLLIDASPDQRLTLMLALEQPALSLADLVRRGEEVTGNREAIDWVFTDLTVPAGEENSLLTVGALPNDLLPAVYDQLRYGLTRLLEAYDYVIVDGFHPLIHALLPEERLHTLTVLTPSQLADWEPPLSGVRTPLVVVNQAQDEAFPPHFEQVLLQGRARLIGKVTKYASAEDAIRRLSEDFQNCLLHMDIPLKFSS